MEGRKRREGSQQKVIIQRISTESNRSLRPLQVRLGASIELELAIPPEEHGGERGVEGHRSLPALAEYSYVCISCQFSFA